MHSTSAHYQSGKYDTYYEILFGENRKRVAKLIGKEISPSHRVADIGGGTGDTIDRIKTTSSAWFTLVEPSETMAEKAKKRKHPPDEILLEDGNKFAKTNTSPLDVVLCQEVIHHIEDLPSFFFNLYKSLREGGKIIIVTRPARQIEFPFGTHGKRSWKESYTQDPTEYVALLERVGFLVSQKIVSLPIQVAKEIWLDMLGEQPIFSNISALTADQRAEDLKELKTLPSDLKFPDKQYFIIAHKITQSQQTESKTQETTSSSRA